MIYYSVLYARYNQGKVSALTQPVASGNGLMTLILDPCRCRYPKRRFEL